MLECTDKLNRTEMTVADKDHQFERLKGGGGTGIAESKIRLSGTEL